MRHAERGNDLATAAAKVKWREERGYHTDGTRRSRGGKGGKEGPWPTRWRVIIGDSFTVPTQAEFKQLVTSTTVGLNDKTNL